MIDAIFFRRFYIGSAILSVLLAGGALAVWGSSRIAGGGVAGCALGVLPFASWQILVKLLATRSGQIAAAGLTVLKYGILSGALYLLLTRGWVHPWALLTGMLSVITFFFALAMTRIGFSPSKGFAQ